MICDPPGEIRGGFFHPLPGERKMANTAGMAASNYPYQTPTSYEGKSADKLVPKELGYIQRVEGIHAGLSALIEKMDSFTAKIGGYPPGCNASEKQESGLSGLLSVCEGLVREMHAKLDKLDSSF